MAVLPNDVHVNQLASETEPSKQLANFLTIADLTTLFNVTPMTIHNWRRTAGLRAYRLGLGDKPVTLFYKPEVVVWAKQQGKDLTTLVVDKKHVVKKKNTGDAKNFGSI